MILTLVNFGVVFMLFGTFLGWLSHKFLITNHELSDKLLNFGALMFVFGSWSVILSISIGLVVMIGPYIIDFFRKYAL
jgi:hypothetical protein